MPRHGGRRRIDPNMSLGNHANVVRPSDAGDVHLTIFVACFNEEENIEATLDVLISALSEFSFTWEVIVIDDASTDQSVKRIQQYISSHPSLPILLHVNARNMGLANNYVDGAFLGRGKYYRLVCGDNVEPKETLVEIFKNIGKADMIIPKQIHVEGRPPLRRFLSGLYPKIINLITGHNISYYNGLAVHLRYNVQRFHSTSSGFNFQADLITTLLDRGCGYIEVPVVARDRQAGKSTALTFKNILSVGHSLLEMVFRRLRLKLYGR
jgi:glycosyltransferase involved in cell wall biosynthesis